MKLKTIIVEDERHSLERLKTLLANFSQIEIIGEATDGESAIDVIDNMKPDLIFLDIELPEFNGFQVLERLSHHPAVIFITSYNQYAIKAFEENAVDYILKPTSKERLEKSINRVAENKTGDNEQILQLLKNKIFQNYQDRFTIKMGDEILLFPEERVYYFKAESRYVFLGSLEKEYIYDSTLKELCDILDPQKFIRVSKSYIVAIDKIEKFSKWFLGDYIIKLKDKKKTSVKIGRKFLPELREKFKF